MTRVGIVVTIAACAVLGLSGPPALGQGSVSEAAEREIHPTSLRLARLHRTHFIRTPDGAIWDLWGEREYLKVYNRVVKKEAIKEARTAEGWTSWITVGYRWEVDGGSRDAPAWGIVPNAREEAPEFLARQATDLPPLWVCAAGAERRFIYINEAEPDVRTKDEAKRSTQVLADLGNGIYKIGVLHGRGLEEMAIKPREQIGGGAFVLVPDPRDVEEGYLPGEFILWPDDSIQLPAGHDGPRYRYLPVEDLHPSPEELIAAIEAADAEIVEWRYDRGASRWVRNEIPLQYRARREARDDARESEQPREPAPSVPVTHLLVLTNGDWVEGQLVSEDETGVLFRVVVGGISTERKYSREEVARVVEK